MPRMIAHALSDRYVSMPDVDLRGDMLDPQTHPAEYCDNAGRLTGRRVYVRIDHDATGTGTTGTGDTVVWIVRGRPPGTNDPDARHSRIYVRVSTEEERTIESHASRASLTTSEYVRRRALRKSTK